METQDNESKAKEIGLKYTYTDEVLHYDGGEPRYFTETFGEETIVAALEMAEWKDQQFKEYLQSKIDKLCEIGCKTNSSEITKSCADKMVVLGEIINELFPKAEEQDNTDREE